jgi:5-methylcytosine-specific restriction endonuclease McrA
MSEPSAESMRLVRLRANDRCEYCRMHQSLQGATFHIEHIHPSSKSGSSQPENLALACPNCNLHKSNRLEVIDTISGTMRPLFHPRQHDWAEHFA